MVVVGFYCNCVVVVDDLGWVVCFDEFGWIDFGVVGVVCVFDGSFVVVDDGVY